MSVSPGSPLTMSRAGDIYTADLQFANYTVPDQAFCEFFSLRGLALLFLPLLCLARA